MCLPNMGNRVKTLNKKNFEILQNSIITLGDIRKNVVFLVWRKIRNIKKTPQTIVSKNGIKKPDTRFERK